MTITSSLSSGGGTDWSRYKPLTKSGQITSGSAGVLTNVLNISGEGFLSKAIAQSSPSQQAIVKVTIDNVVYVWNTALNGNLLAGMILENFLLTYSSTAVGAKIPFNMVGQQQFGGTPSQSTLTSLTGSSGNGLYIAHPIFFKSSLLVDVGCVVGAVATSWDVTGGIV